MESKLTGAKELNGLLNRIGNFDPTRFQTDFDSRLILQKTIYLLQAFGLNLGYRYSWYLRGPYSPDLADVAFSVAKRYDKNFTTKFAVDSAEVRFGEFLQFLSCRKNDYYWMETAASVHFLAKLYGEENENRIFREVQQKMGGTLSRVSFVTIWDYLWRNGLLRNKSRCNSVGRHIS